MRPLWLEGLDNATLVQAIDRAWRQTEWLFSGVDPDALHEQPDPLRNPLIFYVGHTAAFSLNKLGLAGLAEPLDAELQQLFAVGVDPATAADLDRSALYPGLDEVQAFRDAAKERVLAAARACDLGGLGWEHPGWALLMGLNHDLIHFETSSVLIRQLGADRVRPPTGWTHAASLGVAPDNAPVEVPGGQVILGKPDAVKTYSWDNELGQRRVQVAPFKASRQLVSNAEWLRFVQDGGPVPAFWRREGDRWIWRGVFQERELPLDWPAEVTHEQASAYCAWIGARLPTEAEHARLAWDAPRERGDSAFHPAHHLHLASCSPRPVHAGQPTPSGLHDPYGNVWQWLDQDFAPLPGFKTHPWYEDFSTLYFGPDHQMLAGGSWASMGTSASQHYRLWFRPFFVQHAGFRLAW